MFLVDDENCLMGKVSLDVEKVGFYISRKKKNRVDRQGFSAHDSVKCFRGPDIGSWFLVAYVEQLYFVNVIESQRVHLVTVLPVRSMLEWNSMTWLGC